MRNIESEVGKGTTFLIRLPVGGQDAAGGALASGRFTVQAEGT